MKIENRWFWALKLCAVAFNSMATYTVFYNIFLGSGRSTIISALSAILAFILVDLFFLCALIMLEDITKTLQERASWAVTAILLVIANIIIGIKDEGYVAWIPRIGLIMLTLQDVLTWYFEFLTQYRSREAQEKRMRDSQVILRARQKQKAYRRMITSKAMKAAFEEKERRRELDNLNLDTIKVDLEKKVTPLETLPEGIIQLAKNRYGWLTKDGKRVTTTKAGKNYSLPGAVRARQRHLSAVES